MTARRRRWGWIAIVTIGLLALWQFGSDRLAGAAAKAGAPATAASSTDAAVLARIMATPASHATAAPAPLAPREASEVVPDGNVALMRRMKADWCGFGADEYARQADAIQERASAAGNGMVGMEAIEQLKLTPGQEVVDEAIEQARQRWVKALLQRGDPRSRAVAEFLASGGEDAAQARARLQSLARTSSDPMVTALALQRPCEAGACRNIDASQWSRLEPANLQAWLTLLREIKGAAGQAQAGYALERMAAEGRYSRTYEREFKAVLLSLAQTVMPGLMSEAEMQLITGMAAAWAIAGFRPLTDACQSSASGSLQRCEAVLDRLWEGDNQLDRAIALGLARRVVLPAQPQRRARWEPRAREYEALLSWRDQAVERVIQSPSRGASRCDEQLEMRKLVQDMTDDGEWAHWRAEMRAAGADEAGLSAQWRRVHGRSYLDPEPPRR